MEAHNFGAKDAVRRWDKTTPYAMHPIWCAMTLLSETTLPSEIRAVGYIALCLHDVVEDTSVELPDWVHPKAREYVMEMTFDSSEEEFEKLWEMRSGTGIVIWFIG